MFNKKEKPDKKKGKNSNEQVVETQNIDFSGEAITDIDDSVGNTDVQIDDVMEVDIDFGSASFVFNEEDDTVLIDEEQFSSLVDSDGMFEVEVDSKELDEEGKTIKVKKKVKAKKVRRRKKDTDFTIGIMKDENYGDLLPLIKDINVTDINWNGKQLWVDDVTKGRYLSDIVLTNDFVEAFSIRVSNVVSRSFNKYTPKLEAEAEELRITIVHESVSHTGRAISIRKTPAVKRINFMESIRNGNYCTEEVANLMSNSIKGKFNVIICGLPGVGKTELVKFLTNYIFPRDRAITIEDTLELHYADINPGKDCLELKVNEDLFTYTDAIKACLRLLPQWILLSEARSAEVKYLLESVSTGAKCITTLHTDDVRKIPDRVINMIGSTNDQEAILNSVYSFFDVGILIGKKQNDKDGKITRWIEQLCFFNRDNEENECIMMVEDGKYTGAELPNEIMRRFRQAGINDPLKYTFI